ncbi:AvrD family protein [Nocardia sp. N2S4-5]|uniref:AvrD family protein n=1 Tax=Nocardia sp. N2S4-5 TaxID=3351565 RepID=UPI0037CE238F
MTTELIAYADIDEVLGDRAGRFFGEGYKRLTHHLDEIVLDHDEQGRPRATATAGVRYPADWSRKRSRVLEPHLSSLDAAIFGHRLLDVVLREFFGLSAHDIRSAWLPSIRFSSGTAATESLDRFPVTARVTSFEGHTLTVTGELGHGMTLEATVALPVPAAPRDLERATATERGGGFFHDAVYRRAQYLRNVVVTADGTGATAEYELAHLDTAAAGEGVADAYQPSISLVDATVLLAQLSQVVLYELDNIARADSETLWMRRMATRATAPPARYAPGTVSTRIVRSMILTFGGGDWRISSWASDFAGCTVTYDLAHRLPT